MNPDVKAKWLEALRGDEYAQGRLFLSTDGRYCVMGVLCDLAAEAGAVERREATQTVSYGNAVSWPPDEVLAWAGLPVDEDSPTLDQLVDLNDGKRLPFSELADIIEAEL